MYPQSYAYGQVRPDNYGYIGAYGSAYGAAGMYGYPAYASLPPSHASAGIYGVPPVQQELSNPAVFESMYRGQLAQLTFNSKPIITNLTLIAQEHVHRMSTIVAKLVDAHIMMVRSRFSLRVWVYIIVYIVTHSLGTAATSITSIVSDGLDLQERWISLYRVVGPSGCSAVYGVVSDCGSADTEAYGRALGDMARCRPWRSAHAWRYDAADN